MKRCKTCNTLNADHAEFCIKCQAKLEVKPLVVERVKSSKEKMYYASILGVLIVLYGIATILVGLIEQSFSFSGLIYLIIGIAFINTNSRVLETEEYIKNIEKENQRLQKEIKDQDNENSIEK
jgi:hypothetical protein